MANFPLLEDEINRFDEQGFIKVESFINQAQVAESAYYYDRAVTGEIHVPPSGSNHIKGRMVQLVNPSQHIMGWQEHVYFLQASDVAKQLIGQDAVYIYDQMILKPAQYPASWCHGTKMLDIGEKAAVQTTR